MQSTDDPQQIGPYRVLAPIARGGGGMVYRVASLGGGPDLALKLLTLESSPLNLRRFEIEVQAMVRIRHPGVVAVHAAGEHQGTPYLVMDLVEGASLQERLKRGGGLPWREGVELVAQVAEALAACHALGVVHRDLKPDNVLLDAAGRARLADFGLALDLEAAHTRLTQSGTFMGTPGYWAPEQAAGEPSRIGPTTDVYGLGALLYATLTGSPPFRSRSITEALTLVLTQAPDPLSEHIPGIPAELDRLCLRCLEKEPPDRYPSAEAVTVELRAVLGSGQAPRPARRAPLAIVVGLGALGAAGWALRGDPPRAEPQPEVSTTDDPPRAPLDLESLVVAESWDAALLELERRLASDSGDTRALLLRAQVYRGQHEFELALGDLDRLLDKQPDHVEALHQRGAVLRKLKRNQAALVDLDRVLALDPRHGSAYYHRGVIRRRTGNLEAAVEDFDDALRLDKGLEAVALYHRARTYLSQGELGLALGDADRLLSVSPDDTAALGVRGEIKLAAGEPEAALVDLDRLVDLLPKQGEARINRGLALIAAGQREAGQAELRRGLVLNPNAASAERARRGLAND